MYICICNAITSRKVKSAIDSGAINWKQVHAFYGFKPNCGKCEAEIIKFIEEKQTF